MAQPGLTLSQLFMKVRNAVLAETGRKQTPWEHSSLTGNFYFRGGGSVIVEKPTLTPQPVLTAVLAGKKYTQWSRDLHRWLLRRIYPPHSEQYQTWWCAGSGCTVRYQDAEKKLRIRGGRRSEVNPDSYRRNGFQRPTVHLSPASKCPCPNLEYCPPLSGG